MTSIRQLHWKTNATYCIPKSVKRGECMVTLTTFSQDTGVHVHHHIKHCLPFPEPNHLGLVPQLYQSNVPRVSEWDTRGLSLRASVWRINGRLSTLAMGVRMGLVHLHLHLQLKTCGRVRGHYGMLWLDKEEIRYWSSGPPDSPRDWTLQRPICHLTTECWIINIWLFIL